MEIFTQFYRDLAANSPVWVVTWVNFMILLFSLSIPFSFSQREARWMLLGLSLGALATVGAYAVFGLSRLLGLAHLIFWTPTLIYMLTLRGRGELGKTLFSRWVFVTMIVIGISLAFDTVDLIRWILGERGPIKA